jgi:glutamate synthase domain-containing protein 3
MTGGTVVILGKTGVNFAAGMSGGIAYVLDEDQLFDTRCNLEMVDIEYLTDSADIAILRNLIQEHVALTGSPQAKNILERWEEMVPRFVKVFPTDYKIALERIKAEQDTKGDNVTMTEEVFK